MVFCTAGHGLIGHKAGSFTILHQLIPVTIMDHVVLMVAVTLAIPLCAGVWTNLCLGTQRIGIWEIGQMGACGGHRWLVTRERDS